MGEPGNEFLEEHRRVLRLVGQLRRAQTAEDVFPALAELRLMLPPHFAEEEARDGVFQWLLTLEASLGPDVDRLLEDHASLMAEMEALEALTDAENADDELLSDARRFAEHLVDHEKREREALQAALGGDRG